MSVVVAFVAFVAVSPPGVPELPVGDAPDPVDCETEECVPPYEEPELPRRAPPHPTESDCAEGEDCPADRAPPRHVYDLTAPENCRGEGCPDQLGTPD